MSSTEGGGAKKVPSFKRNFEGIIQISNWIKHDHFGVSTTKRANIDPAFYAAVQTYTNVPIKIYYHTKLIDLSFARKRKDGSWEIVVPECFNYCYARFAVCKELCHILTDDSSVQATHPSDQIAQAQFVNLIIQSSDVRLLEMVLSMPSMPSEFFCFFLALEISIPDSKRDDVLVKYNNYGYSANDIAKELSIPETIVEFYLKSYHRISGILKQKLASRRQ